MITHLCAGLGQGQHCGADVQNGEPCHWTGHTKKGDKMDWTQPSLFDTIELTTNDKEQNATIHHTSN